MMDQGIMYRSWWMYAAAGKKLRQKGDSDTALGPDDSHIDSAMDSSESPVEPSRHADDELWWRCVHWWLQQ